MTAPTIDQAFITQFGADVKLAYQRQGSKLRGTTRMRTFQPGNKTRFQKMGKGSAGSKTRHGDITPMNLDHSYVDLTVADQYAGEYADDLDLIKTNIDERQLVAQSEAYAHGRKTDDVILTTLNAASGSGGSTKYASSAAQVMTRGLLLDVYETFNIADIPDDGTRCWIINPQVWTKMMNIKEFVNADYIGEDDLPYKGGLQVKRYLGFMFIPNTGLYQDGSGNHRTQVYHKQAVGHGIVSDLKTDVTWQGVKQSWFIATSMSQGAVVIDATGTLEVVVAL